MENELEETETHLSKFNRYASQKSVSQNLLNTSVIQSHIGLLVYIYSDTHLLSRLEYAAIVLVLMSLSVQTVMFFMLTWLFYVNPNYQYRFLSAEIINGLVTVLSGISLIINIAITSVSLEIKPSLDQSVG